MSGISVIIVTYNSGRLIGGCLDSLIAQKDVGFDLIVVDNCSADDTLEIVRRKMPGARVISNKVNGGFSRGVNQGIALSKAENILLLNGDVILRDDFISSLKEALPRLPKNTVMASPKIIAMDKQHIDSTGLVFSWMRRFYDRGQGAIDTGQFDHRPDIFGPCAAAGVYSRKMLEDIKINGEYFDEDFFLLIEDFDIAWRARRRGWKAVFLPQLVCYHHGGISRRRSPIAQYYSFRNRYLLLIKNAGVTEWLRLVLFFSVYEFPRLVYLLATNPGTLKALKELRELFPKMLRKRKLD